MEVGVDSGEESNMLSNDSSMAEGGASTSSSFLGVGVSADVLLSEARASALLAKGDKPSLAVSCSMASKLTVSLLASIVEVDVMARASTRGGGGLRWLGDLVGAASTRAVVVIIKGDKPSLASSCSMETRLTALLMEVTVGVSATGDGGRRW